MKKVGKNAPCPCGSGKKYKKCCLKKDTLSPELDQEQSQPSPDRIESEKKIITRDALILLGAAIFIFLLYSNTFNSPFLFDDIPNIHDNPYIRLTGLTIAGLKKVGFESLSTFNRAFKENMNKTPTEYRKKTGAAV